PVGEGLAVAADVLAVAAQRDHDEARGPAIDELAAHLRRDAHQLAGLDRLLEDEVDLLLALVAMDASALARLEHELVDPEARHPERAAQRDEALLAVRVEPCSRRAGLHGGDPTTGAARWGADPPGCIVRGREHARAQDAISRQSGRDGRAAGPGQRGPRPARPQARVVQGPGAGERA